MSRTDLALQALREPASMRALDGAGWERLLCQARRADLLGRIALCFEREGLTPRLPAAVQAHLEAAIVLTRAQQREVLREVEAIRAALAPLDLKPVLLKGAAYLVSGGAASTGRTFDDVDLLVPKDRIAEVEAHLMMAGWVGTHLTPYDQRYYREWMHELPPMMHAERHSVLDVHHGILPETVRRRPDSALLLAAAREVPQAPHWRVLCSTDMVLHSMCHLFHNDELSHGLRDLSDLDLMLRDHGRDAAYWTELLARAEALHLGRTLHYGLQCTHRLLGTPVPPEVLQLAARHAAPSPIDGMMCRAWQSVLHTPHSSGREPLTGLAQRLLYLRAHALRMPPAMLARHLAVKAWRRHVLKEAGA